MWNKPGALIGLAIGCWMIFYRRQVIGVIFQKQLARAKPKTLERYQQLGRSGVDGILYKMGAIMVLSIGVLLVLMSLSELLEEPGKYIRYSVAFLVLLFFAAGGAAVVEFTLIFHWLWRNVRTYIREHYGDSYVRIDQRSPATQDDSASRWPPDDDPILKALRKKAALYSVLCFVVLFGIFVAAFYAIFRITS